MRVAPWRDPNGDLVAAGRWVEVGDGPFCGLGIFRVSDSAVISLVATDVLPIGLPCWVPGESRIFLFSGGDGRLHRCRIPAQGDEGGIADTTDIVPGKPASVPVSWKVNPPGNGEVILTDPVWSLEPKLRKFVIVALNLQSKAGRGSVFQPSRLWWLEMNDEADTILSAGPLTGSACDAADDDNHAELYPNIASGPGGETQLVYLMRHGSENSLRLQSARLGFDLGSGQPRLESGSCQPGTLSEGLQKAPLLISVDGGRVFGLDSSGQVGTFTLAGKPQGSHAVGRRER